MKDFIVFIREQGVVGLAIGFMLGGAINNVISSFVKDILQPMLGAMVGTNTLLELHFKEVMFGRFLVALIDFILLASVVYFIFKRLKLENLDLKKDK